jgi:DNA-binding HxlR family transcriptional regulator
MAKAADLVGDTHALLIVRDLLEKPRRFGELTLSLSGVSTRTLTLKLKALEKKDVLVHKSGLYSLTPKGKALRPVIATMRAYGEKFL